jgi:S1-C subfamily serine protease
MTTARLLLVFLLTLPALAADRQQVLRADRERAAILRAAADTVVAVRTDPTSAGGGSGVIIDPRGYGLSNYHVVAAILRDDPTQREGFGGMSDGRMYPLTVVGIDPGGDVALFKLHGRDNFPVAPLGDSDDLVLGQRVAAIGDPFGLAEDLEPTITLGFITGLNRYQPAAGPSGALEYADCIQFSSSINPGNSGGPLFDMQGRVVGINGRASFKTDDMAGRGRVNVGIGYAISINQTKRFLPRLYAGQLTAHGTLGATVRSVGAEVIVDAIETGSPADRAGLELGDRVVAIDEERIRGANDYLNAVVQLPANWPLKLTVLPVGANEPRDLIITTAAQRVADIPVWVPDFRFVQAARQRAFPTPLRGDESLGSGEQLRLRGTWQRDAGMPAEVIEITFVPSLSAADLLSAWIATPPPASAADAPEIWRSWLLAVAPWIVPLPAESTWTLDHQGALDSLGVVAWTANLPADREGTWRFEVTDRTPRDITVTLPRADGGAELTWTQPPGAPRIAVDSLPTRIPAVWQLAGERATRVTLEAVVREPIATSTPEPVEPLE